EIWFDSAWPATTSPGGMCCLECNMTSAKTGSRNAHTGQSRKSRLWCITAVCFVGCTGSAQEATSFRAAIPRVWDEAALEDWVTPVATLNVRPKDFSTREYYSAPEHNLRSYPVYMPGREPERYWDILQRVGQQPLIEPEKLKTDEDWTKAGQRVFDEASTPQLTTFDPDVIATLRSREYLERQHAVQLADGTLGTLR